ncbi:MAG: hypothetical protein H3C47_14455 [Candidatus Cloacimonetes bacterium]|nr:hypothetical protein [Candidatus Cloacimonadota bacterium]
MKWLTLFRLVLLALAVVSAVTIWQQYQLEALALIRIDPIPVARTMVSEGRYAEAGGYLGFFMDYDYVNHNPEALGLYEEISSKRSSWEYQFSKFGEGLLTGSSDETIGKAAGFASDFFVIGDIRDLMFQGVNLAKGEEVDKTLVALASLGVIASAAQVASAGGTAATAGAMAPAVAGTTVAKSGLIALKAAKKLGKLPSWLNKIIIQSKTLDGLSEVLTNVNTLAKTPGGLNLLSQASNASELGRMAKFADIFGAQSAAIYRVGGRTVIEIAQRADKIGKDTIRLATTFGQDGLKLLDKIGALKFTKVISRATKMAYKGDVFQLLARFLLWLPPWVKYLLIVIGLLVWVPWRMLSAFYRWCCRRVSNFYST